MTRPRTIPLRRSVSPASPLSPRVLEVATMFGLDLDDEASFEIIAPCTIPIPEGGIIFITGPSGGGKTTILALLAERLQQTSRVIAFGAAPLREDQALVDQFDLPLMDSLAHLSRAGLADAFTLTRTPRQLSDGQRYRLHLALAMASADAVGAAPAEGDAKIIRLLATSQTIESARSVARGRGDHETDPGAIILADEFGATLDRLTAKMIARNIRRWITHTPHTFIAATTHDDLLEWLDPDVLVYKALGARVEVIRRKPEVI